MRLGSNKRVSPEVIPNVAANMEGEVVAALVIGATTKRAALEEGSIEAQVLASDTGHDISAKLLLSNPINGIEIVKNRTVRLDVAERRDSIHSLSSPPRHFTAESDVVLKTKNAAEAWVQSTAQRWE